jgi:hypothetical protein
LSGRGPFPEAAAGGATGARPCLLVSRWPGRLPRGCFPERPRGAHASQALGRPAGAIALVRRRPLPPRLAGRNAALGVPWARTPRPAALRFPASGCPVCSVPHFPMSGLGYFPRATRPHLSRAPAHTHLRAAGRGAQPRRGRRSRARAFAGPGRAPRCRAAGAQPAFWATLVRWGPISRGRRSSTCRSPHARCVCVVRPPAPSHTGSACAPSCPVNAAYFGMARRCKRQARGDAARGVFGQSRRQS